MTKSMIAVSVAFLSCAAPAFAVALPSGTTTNLPGTTVAARPELAGVVLEDDTTAYSFNGGAGVVNGTVQSRVSRSNSDGTLTFSWRIETDGSSEDTIRAFRLGGFGTFANDGDYRIDSLGEVGPSDAYNFGNGNVNFNFTADELDPGQSSLFFFLKTTATTYAATGLFDLVSGNEISGAYATFAPTAAVPEPATWLMMIAGFGLVGAAARRRATHRLA